MRGKKDEWFALPLKKNCIKNLKDNVIGAFHLSIHIEFIQLWIKWRTDRESLIATNRNKFNWRRNEHRNLRRVGKKSNFEKASFISNTWRTLKIDVEMVAPSQQSKKQKTYHFLHPRFQLWATTIVCSWYWQVQSSVACYWHDQTYYTQETKFMQTCTTDFATIRIIFFLELLGNIR